MNKLSSAERRALRARAHSLNPVVIIGNGGLTPGVTAEVERSLKAHELIKIRIGGMEHAEREAACETLCGQTGAAQIQHIGKILVIYRKHPVEKTKAVPRKPRKKDLPPGGRIGKPFARSDSTSKARGARSDDGARRPRTTRG